MIKMTETVYPDNNQLRPLNLEAPDAFPVNGTEDVQVSCLNVTSGTYRVQKLDSRSSREHKETECKSMRGLTDVLAYPALKKQNNNTNTSLILNY